MKDPQLVCKLLVMEHYNTGLADDKKVVSDLVMRRGQGYEIEHTPDSIDIDDVYVVSFFYILGGWKSMLSTVVPDDRYYEITYDKVRDKIYVDCWKKESNTEIDNDHPVFAI